LIYIPPSDSLILPELPATDEDLAVSLLLFSRWQFISGEHNVLVLSRKVGERIWIGNEICVTVVRLTSGGVRLGIEAPAELPVIREELKVRQAESQAAESKAQVEIVISEAALAKLQLPPASDHSEHQANKND
jgi:carbon storage regulator